MKRTRLETLGRKFDQRVREAHSARPTRRSNGELEREIAEIDVLAMPIINASARSLADLAVKARAALWLCGDYLSDDTPGEAATSSIIRDLIALDRKG